MGSSYRAALLSSRSTASAMTPTFATEVLGGTVEFLGPIADFGSFVDAGAIGRAAVLKVVGHERSRVSGMCAKEKIGEGWALSGGLAVEATALRGELKLGEVVGHKG